MRRLLLSASLVMTVLGCHSPTTTSTTKTSVAAKASEAPFKLDGKASNAFTSGYQANVNGTGIETYMMDVAQTSVADNKYSVELSFLPRNGSSLTKGFDPKDAVVSQVRITLVNKGEKTIKWFRRYGKDENDYVLSFTETTTKIVGKIKGKVYAVDTSDDPVDLEYSFNYNYM